MDVIDLRGDSAGRPTQAMRNAMRDAPPGGYADDDPSVRALEAACAALLGKEAAIFTPSVTMAHLILLMHTCKPGEEIIVDDGAHLYRNELGGLTRIAGVLPRVVPRTGALPRLEDVEKAFRDRAVHAEPIRLVWTENTHNWAGGAVATPQEIDDLANIAAAHGAGVAMDGARLFNASTHLNLPPAELVRRVDAVAITFTKALAAPFGSVLVGSGQLIDHAKTLRRLLGGNVKKAGPMAAACLVALNTVRLDLANDHNLASSIGALVERTDGIRLAAPVMTNLVKIDTSLLGTAAACVDVLAEHGVLAQASGATSLRLATHRSVSIDDLNAIAEALAALPERLTAQKPSSRHDVGSYMQVPAERRM